MSESSQFLWYRSREFQAGREFPPHHSSGIVVLEVTPRAETDTVLARIADLIAVLKERELGNELWILEPGRVRIHQQP